MNIPQLKILIQTSNVENNEPIELTSDILHYDPPKNERMPLLKYPLFDPNTEYDSHEIVQDMPYYKRLQVFFNEKMFMDTMLNKDKTDKRKQEVLEEKKNQGTVIQDNNVNEEASKISENKDANGDNSMSEFNENFMNTVKNNNFEFTLKTILPTGYIPDNYTESIDYYDPNTTRKLFTLKASRPSFLSKLLPRRYKRFYSYVNINKEIHTVHSVMWINDALNHPRYRPIAYSYVDNKSREEQRRKQLETITVNTEKDLDNAYRSFITKILLYLDKFQYNKLGKQVSSTETQTRINLNDAMYEIVGNEKDLDNNTQANNGSGSNKNNAKIKEQVEKTTHPTRSKLKNFSEKIKEQMKTYLDRPENVSIQKLYEKKAKKNRDEWLFYYILNENKDTEVVDKLKKQIIEATNLLKENYIDKYLVEPAMFNTYTNYKKSRSFLTRSSTLVNSMEIMNFLEKVSYSNMILRAISYKVNGASYDGDDDKEEITKYLKEQMPNIDNLQNSINKLNKEVVINNKFWKEEIKKRTETNNNEGISNEKNILEQTMVTCIQSNQVCKKSGSMRDAFKYLSTGLDTLKTKDKTTYEAHVHLNVIKGKITNDNMSGLSCTLNDFMLGFLIEQYNLEKTNSIPQFYLDLAEDIAKIENSKNENAGKTKKKLKKQNTKPNNKVGSKTKKQKRKQKKKV